jgi:hypothetical protein
VIRADLVYALVQRLADLAADAEGQPRRGVPRLDSDLSLVDQVRVISADLSRVADAEVRREAATLVDTVHDAL